MVDRSVGQHVLENCSNCAVVCCNVELLDEMLWFKRGFCDHAPLVDTLHMLSEVQMNGYVWNSEFKQYFSEHWNNHYISLNYQLAIELFTIRNTNIGKISSAVMAGSNSEEKNNNIQNNHSEFFFKYTSKTFNLTNTPTHTSVTV